MARGLGETTCLLSVCGEASNTRRCICELTRASVKPAAPLDSISTSTMARVHIRALAAQRRTMLTSPSCPSAWQPNPGRGSTYRRGNSVQRIGTTAAHRENQGRSLDPQKKPQENSYRIFYSLKYIPYTHSTCRIYSLLVPGIYPLPGSGGPPTRHLTLHPLGHLAPPMPASGGQVPGVPCILVLIRPRGAALPTAGC